MPKPLTIGLVFDLFDDYKWKDGEPEDADAELEPEDTVLALEEAFRALGHHPVRIGTTQQLLSQLTELRVDVAMSIAEMGNSRNRESYAPILFEMAGIPHLGSDALTLSLSLDKVWTNDLVEMAGVPCPKRWTVPVGNADFFADHTEDLGFPFFVKPRYEGTAKGITPASKVYSIEALHAQIAYIHQTYKQDALVEAFVEGSEFTVAVIGHHPAQALPILQRATEKETGIGLHALERKGVIQQDWSYELHSALTPALEAEIQQLAQTAFHKLECKDYARADFRVTTDGKPFFLEINTLPTFAPDGSFAILAELMGISYTDFLADVLRRGLQRLGFS